MKTVISVVGVDMKGIIAGVSQFLSKNDINIIDISQTVMDEVFAMIMLVDMEKTRLEIKELRDLLDEYGEKNGLSIHVQHEDIFNVMHKI